MALEFPSKSQANRHSDESGGAIKLYLVVRVGYRSRSVRVHGLHASFADNWSGNPGLGFRNKVA